MVGQPIPSFDREVGSNVTHIFGSGNGIHERVGFVFTASDEIGEYFDAMLKPSVAKGMGRSAYNLFSRYRLPVERLEQNKFSPADNVALHAMERALEEGRKGSSQKPLARYMSGHLIKQGRKQAIRLDFGVVVGDLIATQLQELGPVDGVLPVEHYTMPIYWMRSTDNLRPADMTNTALQQLRHKLLSENEATPWHPSAGMNMHQPSKGGSAYVTNMRLRSKRRS